MITIQMKTSRKTQVPMGRWRQEWHENDETCKMDRTIPRSPHMEGYCWESQDCTGGVVQKKKKKGHILLYIHRVRIKRQSAHYVVRV
jgi:hypothetical protein